MTTTHGSNVWVRFTADHDHREPGFTIAYKAGMTQNVTAKCATLAIAAGRAVRLRKTSKDEEPVEWLNDPQPAPYESE